MIRKLITIVLICAVLAAISGGCSEAVGEIAGNVADAAMKELEASVKATFEKYKVDVIELKSAIGKLTGDSGDNQFFCAALVQSDSDALPQSCADALSKVFHDAGIAVQTGSNIESSYLEHKQISFKYSSFEEGKTYYLVYCYIDRIPDLKDLKEFIPTGTDSGVG